MKNKIQFFAETKEMLEVLDKPFPAIQKIPDWVAKTPSYVGGKPTIDNFSDPNSTAKKCMPLFDAMTAGYFIPLHTDLWIEGNGTPNLDMKWSWNTIQLVEAHSSDRYEFYPIPEGYNKLAFKWINPWIIKTPPGWSCLFTHPMHYDDLPFRSMSAIVDTDKHPQFINLPFILKDNFNGLIPKGVPLIQVIPFKRGDFISEFSYDKDGYFKNLWTKAHTVFFDRYKKFFRSPKKYLQGEVVQPKCPFSFLKKGSK